MKIVDDVPGRRLTLKGEGTTLPFIGLWLVLVGVSPLVLVPAWILWRVSSGPFVDPEQVLYGLVWVGGTVGVLSSIWIRIRRFPALLEVDHTAGRVRLGYRALFGGELDETVLAFDTIERVSVERLAPGDKGAGTTGSELRVGFHVRPWPGAGVSTTLMKIAVDGVDRSEEVADFAFRLAAAAGLPGRRVVRNDPRAVEVELSRGTPPAAAPVPEASPRADAAPVEAAPDARTAVAREIVEAFRPASFAGDHEVKAWTPGVEVVFRRSWDGMLFLFGLPFLFTGPAVYLWESGRTTDYSDLLRDTVLAAVIGLMIGIPSLVGLFSSRSRTVRLDWARRVISIREGSSSRAIPMADVAAVELACHHETQGGGGAGTGTHSSNVVIHRYHCAVRVHWREAGGEPASATLIETEEADEPDPPYREALPLATELARSLGVERRVTDFGPGSRRRPPVA